MIKKGLIKKYNVKIYELFDKNYKIIQCFNCQQYEYIGKVYKTRVINNYCVKYYRSFEYEYKEN